MTEYITSQNFSDATGNHVTVHISILTFNITVKQHSETNIGRYLPPAFLFRTVYSTIASSRIETLMYVKIKKQFKTYVCNKILLATSKTDHFCSVKING